MSSEITVSKLQDVLAVAWRTAISIQVVAWCDQLARDRLSETPTLTDEQYSNSFKRIHMFKMLSTSHPEFRVEDGELFCTGTYGDVFFTICANGSSHSVVETGT